MSSPLSVKRRKLNDATHTLSKPFVSPLRSTKSQRVPLKEDHGIANRPYTPSTLAHTVGLSHAPLGTEVPDQEQDLSASKSKPPRKQHVFGTSSKRTDPSEKVAQRALMAIERQIKETKNDIDALKQAARISSTNTDAELEELAEKWRRASQEAAEELFGAVKERVCRMGGVAAWRESEKRKFDRSHGLGEFAEQPPEDNDEDCEYDSQGEELPEAEQEYRKSEKKRMKQEAMDAADVEEPIMDEEPGGPKAVWAEGGGDDDAFTMDMMLRSLNIELKVIGYDKTAQRWKS